MSDMFVIGIIAYLSATGTVDDFQFGKFSSVDACNGQSASTIVQYKAAHPEVKDDSTPVLCWDTRPVQKAPAKPARSPNSVDL